MTLWPYGTPYGAENSLANSDFVNMGGSLPFPKGVRVTAAGVPTDAFPQTPPLACQACRA